MSVLFNVGVRALQADQLLLQAAGNNIANVNTPGYSRQTVLLKDTPGQFTGIGYIGNGVEVQTVERNYSAFLTRQSMLASTTATADSARSDKFRQLESIFSGGAQGLGAAINDMLNSFSDVASAPTDLTARSVALTRVDETAARLRSAAQSLDDLRQGIAQELTQKVSAVNGLTQSIARLNGEIARSRGSNHAPNDLLDQRDQAVRELNQYVQTTSVAADDGSVGIFIAGSQTLVLGTTVSPVAIARDDFGDPATSKLVIDKGGQTFPLNESNLGGGEISGLLRFQNGDLNDARNLLGRMTLAISRAMNTQHNLGLDLNGKSGGDLFTPTVFDNHNVMQPQAPAATNTGSAALTLSVADPTQFVASDYEITFTSASAGNMVRKSDGVVTAFGSVPITVDGFAIGVSGSANSGDRFLIKPFATAASTIDSALSSPSALAVASPVAASVGSGNTGTLALDSLSARSIIAALPTVTLTFDGAGHYTRSDYAGPLSPFTFTVGQPIEYNFATPGTTGWSLNLKGTPQADDTVTVQAQPTANRNLNAGNASAMLALRDVAMFDGVSLSDGYSSIISQIGIRSQSASFSAQISTALAADVEKERTGISGVNLDEEAAKLLQFQQAYQASAKVIQVAQNLFDTLLQSVGR